MKKAFGLQIALHLHDGEDRYLELHKLKKKTTNNTQV